MWLKLLIVRHIFYWVIYTGNMSKKFIILPLIISVVWLGLPIGSAQATVSCTFDRNLDIGMNGEDIRCLQRYLNATGITIANTGVGSPGNETSLFRDLTKQAVIRWQQKHSISPASGFFGPLSRQKYNQLVSGIGVPTVDPNPVVKDNDKADNPGYQNQILDLIAKLQEAKDEIRALKQNNSNSAGESKVKDEIKNAIRMIKDAEDAVEDSDAVDDRAEDDLSDARDDFDDAIKSYFHNDYQEALEYAREAYENAKDAFDQAGGESFQEELEDLISELEEELEDLESDIENADDDGDDVDEAEDLYEEADDLLDEAKDAFDDQEYDEAEELLKDVEDLIEEAYDELDGSGRNRKNNNHDDEEDAEDAIEDAEDAIDEAEDEIDTKRRGGKDVDGAEELLADAKDRLDDAEDAFDDEDWDDAIEYALEAEELANEALDEL